MAGQVERAPGRSTLVYARLHKTYGTIVGLFPGSFGGADRVFRLFVRERVGTEESRHSDPPPSKREQGKYVTIARAWR